MWRSSGVVSLGWKARVLLCVICQDWIYWTGWLWSWFGSMKWRQSGRSALSQQYIFIPDHQGLISRSWWLFTPPLLSGLISFHKYFPCSYGDLDGVIIPPIVSWVPSCSLRWIETVFVSATEIDLAQLFLRDASPRCGRSLTCRDAASSGRPLALLPDGGAGTANETQT